MTDDQPLLGLIALVTGASRGIGRACAIGLAKAGAHVIATARTQGALESLDDEIRALTGRDTTLVPLDLKDGDGIDRLGGAVFDRWRKLDILVSAAGELGVLTPVSHLDPSVWERTVAVNMTANYRLIRSFDPLLRQSAAGRAIFLTSGAARSPQAFWGVYAATKAGLEAMVETWRDETAITPVRPVLLSPGPMRTRMRAAAFPGEDPETLSPPEAIVPLVVDLCRPDREPPTGVVRFTP
ncbi:MAG TPA: SDR family NAD(P)-dependent oxidoreductase [Caulobacteraceae bacterium]|jgi:NAD(P)-dependent dehydrogenase (short-subunit alcohol dehydrogenase family)|nr:SDR family NAD(P)-dependent oxidoreductase [Caulobacteraceae bacterium]